jgi:hypothetical protein
MSQSIKNLHEKFSIKEMYNMTEGDRNVWGIYGYTVPKTYAYTDIEHLFPKEKRQDATSRALKRASEPDPTKYSPTMEALTKSQKVLGGLFSKSKKESMTEEAIKQSKKTPGPGKYLEEPNPKLKKNFTLGKFE